MFSEFRTPTSTKVLGAAALLILIAFLASNFWQYSKAKEPRPAPPPDISEDTEAKNAEVAAGRVLGALSYAEAAESLAQASLNFSPLETELAGDSAKLASSYADAYAALAIKNAVAEYQKNPSSKVAQEKLASALLAVYAGIDARSAKERSQKLAEAAKSVENFNSSLLGQLLQNFGIQKQALLKEGGAEEGYVVSVNSLGGLGAIAGVGSGFGSLSILGNVLGSLSGTSEVGQVAVFPSLGLGWNFGEGQSNEVGGAGVLNTDDGYSYEPLEKPNFGEAGAQCVSNYGDFCFSSPNSCGLINPGRINCSGFCTAIVPGNSACPSPTIAVSKEIIYISPGAQCQFSWQAENVRYCLFETKKDTGEEIKIITGGHQSFKSVSLSQRLSYKINCYNGDFPPFKRIGDSSLFEATGEPPGSAEVSKVVTCLPTRPEFENR